MHGVRPTATRPRAWDWVAVALNLLVIGFLTLRPSSGDAASFDATCVLCGERGSADLLLNLVLFAPLGAVLGRLGWRPVLIAGLGLALSLGIEIAQTVLPGRAPTWRDVVTNGVGAGLGAIAVQWLVPLVRASWARQLAWLSGGVAITTVVLTGWLLHPDVKPSSWYGQLAPRLGQFVPWDGQLDSTSIGEIRVRHGRLPNAAAVQVAVAARAPITLFGTTAPPPQGLAALFALTDEEYEEMFLIGQGGNDLVVRERRRASTFRFFEPEHRFAGFFARVPPGTPFTLEIRPAATSVCAVLHSDEMCAERFALSSAWALLIWRRWYGPFLTGAFGALTMAVLFFPVGLFGAALTPRARGLLFTSVAGGVLVGAQVVALARPDLLELVAAILALLAGQVAGTRLRRPASAQRATAASTRA